MTAEAARKQVGLSVEDVAKRLRRCPRYIRQIELHGKAPEHLARRLAQLYQCPMEHFLYGRKTTEANGTRR